MKSTTKQASTTESSFKTPARAPERELVPEFRSCTPKKKTERTFLPPQVDVQEVSYLGQKGYTLPKSAFTPDQLDQLKESLIARPMVMGGMLQTCPVYPIYRESEKNIYMPRYFGIQHYGPPKECQLPEGDPIDVPFRGTLRDHQLPAVQAYMDLVQQPHQRHAAGLLELNCASGKCLGKDETVLMFDGTIKCVQEVRLGDVLMGDDSTPRRVLSLAKGRDVLYRISDPYGGSYVVNRSHILSLKWVESRYQVNKGDILDVNVLDVLRYPKTYRGLLSPLRGFRVPIEFPAVSVPMDPYMIGYMFGGSSKDEPTKSIDGVKRVEPLCGSERFLDSLSRIPEGNPTTNDLRSCPTSFVVNDAAVLLYLHYLLRTKYVHAHLEYTGEENKYRMVSFDSTTKEEPWYRVLGGRKASYMLPHCYKCNHQEIRYKVLAGILDSIGTYDTLRNRYVISSDDARLMRDVTYIARSLGFLVKDPSRRPPKPVLGSKNVPEEEYSLKHNMSIQGPHLSRIPVLCARNKPRIQKILVNDGRCLTYRIKITKEEERGEYYGFVLDGNCRFVLGDFTVTHNTVMSLNLISQLRTKTLIVVNKEFLLNQWMERIQEFLPTARVGRIQGPVIDIDQKDIVIGMLQSSSMKKYPSSTFDSFGLTVVDEVHHISSEVFSSALFKIVTKYMLGLSATMERKDGTTNVIKMFLGEVTYKGVSDEQHQVLVRAIEYRSPDVAFQETEYDFRGNPQYSKMIVKLCDYGPRSDFIVRVLEDLIQENGQKQIMILGHNRSLLTYVHDAIVRRGFATVG